MKLLPLMLLTYGLVGCEGGGNGTAPNNSPVVIGSFNVTKGTASTTTVTSLKVKDQTGTTETAGKFVQFNTNDGFQGTFNFPLTATYDLNDFSELKVEVNFKGLPASVQSWTFEVWDGFQWIALGVNELETEGEWNLLSFRVNADKDYLKSNQLQVRMTTTDNDGPAKIDYITAVLNPSADPAPGPGPGPGPDPIPDPDPTPDPTPGPWWKPVIGTKWTIQYSGTLVQKPEYMIYNIDLYDTPKATIDLLHSQGKKVICYFSGGSYEDWRPDAGDFPAAVLGNDLDGWPGERWLDVRAITSLKPIMKKRVDLAKSKGCDAVDPDNMDGYTNSPGFPMTYQHQLAYNKMIAQLAHDVGLAVGLKNDLDQIVDLVDHFDFAVNEQCYQYNECDMLKPFINQGKPVYNMEYSVSVSTFCPKSKVDKIDAVKKRLDLDSWVDPCWNR